MVSARTVGRLGLYRRLLRDRMREPGASRYIYSHELAALAGATAAQVRRDVMHVGYTGNPARGYDVERLVEGIAEFLDAPAREAVALAGVGNLGRALLAYFGGRHPLFEVTAAFDSDPEKAGRVIHGCRCYPASEIADVVRAQGIKVGVLAVPAEAAQDAVSALCAGGVRGVVSFVPVRLWVPPGVYVEDVDVTMALECVAYFARQGAGNGMRR